jgi:hypothetical protein
VKSLFPRAGLRQAGLLGLFLLYFHCIILYNPLCVLAPLRADLISQRREAAKKKKYDAPAYGS